MKILGTPTEADFHPDDPNPGILDPAIRAEPAQDRRHGAVTRTPARATRAARCSSSGRAKTYLAGVGFWTGLFCEDYAIFTRIDPFLATFDDAVTRAGKAPIVPRLECVEPQATDRSSRTSATATTTR